MSSSDYTVPPGTIEAFLNQIIFQLYERAKGMPGANLTWPVVADPASIHEILSDPVRFPKNMGLIGALGDSRFNTNGSQWKARRDITQRFYLAAGSARNAANVRATYEARLAPCEPSIEHIQQALMLAGSETFFRAFDCAVNPERLHGFFERARQFAKRLQYFSWNAPDASDVSALSDEGGCLARDFGIEVAQSSPLRELMMAFSQKAGSEDGFDPIGELLMNFLAGIETTAATLSFAIDRLGLDRRIQQRLYDEAVSGGEAYLNCFILETLRYFPTIPFVVREAASDIRLTDTFFPKGQTILISIVGLHHDPQLWNEPDVFDSARREFLDDTYDRGAFLPFLAGPRMCGGAKLAKVELIEGLKAFVRRFEVTTENDAIGFDYGLALRPRASGKVTISRRSARTE